jgi:arsenate reductase
MRYSFTMNAKIYHNPRCSKSRATLALLEERGIPVEIIDYLQNSPSADTIRTLLRQLDLDAADIVRTGEPAFKASGLTVGSPADALIELIAREPGVLERPIVVCNGRARIGRPPERVLELFT